MLPRAVRHSLNDARPKSTRKQRKKKYKAVDDIINSKQVASREQKVRSLSLIEVSFIPFERLTFPKDFNARLADKLPV